VEAIYELRHREFDLLTSVAALHRLAKVSTESPGDPTDLVPESLVSAVVAMVADPQAGGSFGLASTAWSLSRLLMCDLPLIDAIASSAIRRLTQLTCQDLSNFAWAFATLILVDVPFCNAISSEAIRKSSLYDP